MIDRLNTYIDDVLAGRIVTGELQRLAVERHVRDLDSGDWVFDEKQARKAVRLFEIMRHWKQEKAGHRIKLEPHQVFRIASLWGWRDEDGLRRFRRALYLVARKNAKTTEAAINAIIHLLLDDEHGAQIWATATKEEQARVVINDIGQIVKGTPELAPEFDVFKYRNMIQRVVLRKRLAFAAPLGQDSKTQDGIDPSWGIVDEYHEHKTADRYNIIESGMGGRRQPFIETITTAGFNKSYPCYSTMRDQAIKILKGQLTDERFFPFVCELDDSDDWHDKEVWVKANPNLGASVRMDYLETRYTKAVNEGGATEVDFKTKNLNMWVDSARSWVSDDTWMRQVADDQLARGPAYGGLDLAPVRDFSSFVLYFSETGYVKSWHWINTASFEQRYEKMPADLRKWRDDGWLTVTAGDTTDYRRIEDDMKRLDATYDIRSIGFDKAYSSQLVGNLTDHGMQMTPFAQGIVNMTYPTTETERRIISGELWHDGSPVLRWMMGNVITISDPSGNTKLDKGRSSDKIDGAVAMVMAVGESITFKDEDSFGGVAFVEF